MTESSTDDNKAAFVDGLEVLPTFDTEKTISGMLYCM